MKALVLTSYGGPDCTKLTDIAKPTPQPGQLLIRVHAAGLNPVDFKIREGKLKMILKYSFPVVMGNELSGVVEAVGEGVNSFKVGDKVFTRVAKDTMGAIAEYAVVNQDIVAPMPKSLDFRTSAAVPLAALTALQAIRDELQVKPGDKIFIPGGAGGVGTFAIQIAKHLGCYVATTASSRGEALVKRMGADLVIDYTTENFEEKLKDYDCAFDLLGGKTLENIWQILKPGSRVVSVAGLPEPDTAKKDLKAGMGLSMIFWVASFGIRRRAKSFGCTYRFLFMKPSRSDLEYLTELIDSKKIEVVVDKNFPFSEAKEAMAYLEAGKAKGKVVIDIID